MKKNFFLALTALALLHAGCKKERTCECTSVQSSTSTDTQGVTTVYTQDPQTTKTTYKKSKKSDIATVCGDRKYSSSSSYSSSGGTSSGTSNYEVKCKIK